VIGMDYMLSDLIQMFGFKERTIRRHMQENKLKGKKINGKWYFSRSDLEDYFSNDKIVKYRKQIQINKALDYINGFQEYRDRILIIVNKYKMNPEDIEDVLEFTKNLKGFTFNFEKLNGAYNFIFEVYKD
jgi:hypothetical protein